MCIDIAGMLGFKPPKPPDPPKLPPIQKQNPEPPKAAPAPKPLEDKEKKPKVEVFEIISQFTVTCFGFCVETFCTIMSWLGCEINFKATGNKASPQKAGGNDDDMMPAGTSITAKGVEVKHLKALLKAKNLSVSYRKKDDLIKRLQVNNIKQF